MRHCRVIPTRRSGVVGACHRDRAARGRRHLPYTLARWELLARSVESAFAYHSLDFPCGLVGVDEAGAGRLVGLIVADGYGGSAGVARWSGGRWCVTLGEGFPEPLSHAESCCDSG